MAKNLIPEELDALIKEYLTDGVLTDKERQVILKKAEGMKLDRDEIDLYLDAQVQKIDQATDAAVRRQKGKACPHCGAYVSQMTDKCPECGQYITPEATKELEEILDNLEEALVNMKSRKDFDRNKAIVERYERKARMYYSNHPKIKALLVEVDEEMKKAEKAYASEIRKKAVANGASSFINGTLKNAWFWAGIPFVLAVILFIKCQGISIDDYIGEYQPRARMQDAQGILGIIIFCLCFGGVFGLIAAANKNKKK